MDDIQKPKTLGEVQLTLAPTAPEPVASVIRQEPSITYPIVEELTFKAFIKSQDQGYALLRAIQILVNELGAETIISAMDTVEKKPALIQKAKAFLPYINML